MQNLLKRSPVFSTLIDEDLNTLETLFTTITLDDNQVLCKEGSRVDHVYVVKRGFLRVFKAFLPEDGQRPRPPSRGTLKVSSRATSRGSLRATLRATPRPKIVKNDTEPANGGTRLMHFDLGEIGPKDILGENGVLQQVEGMPSMPLTSSLASTLPAMPINREPKDRDPERDPGENLADAAAGDAQEVGGNANAVAADGAASSAISARQSKATYLVSATASGGKAEVYVAKAHELKKAQTESFRYSWKTAQRLHQARAQAWSAAALAQQLRRQQEWGVLRRETVLEALAMKNV